MGGRDEEDRLYRDPGHRTFSRSTCQLPGGTYAFSHNGLHANGNYGDGVAYLGINPNGDLSLFEVGNEVNVGVHYTEGSGSTWQWVAGSPCEIHLGDGPQDDMYGIASSDGNTIVIWTMPPADESAAEYMSGTAVRTDD